MDLNKMLRKIKLKHLWYLLIFLSVLVTRSIAADRLAASNSEAGIFINLVSSSGESEQSSSMLYQMLTKPLVALFGDTLLVLRFWVILSGALITLLPLLYENILGQRTALILAFLLALDPFQVANGIQASGSTLTILTLLAAVGMILRKRYGLGALAFAAFLLSGLNVHYGFGLLFLVAVMIAMFELHQELFKVLRNLLQYLRKKITAILILSILAALLLFVLGIPFSDGLAHLSQVFQNWTKPYNVGNFPQLYPLALLSYLPICWLTLYPAGRSRVKREVVAALYLGLLVMLLLAAFYPGHSVMDLVWVSMPLSLLCTIKINNLIEGIREFSLKTHIYTLLLLFVLVSLAIQFGMLVYKFQYGMNLLADLLSLLVLLILFIMGIVFISLYESLSTALKTARTGILLLVITIQLAFSWRAAGMNGNPAAEILWDGYFEGEQTLDGIIKNADLKTINTDWDNQVALLDYEDQAVEWSIGRHYPVEKKQFGLGETKYAVVITQTETGMDDLTLDGYYGQTFIAQSYPRWTWRPIESLLTGDYWSWMLRRQSEQIRVYHYVWLNENLFQ